MTTTASAATLAGVTVATIRTWCRMGAVTATKRSGRWVIDSASLARRITIGTWRTPVATPNLITNKTSTPGALGVIGVTEDLRAAYASRRPITLGGKFAGERVYLGHTRQTYGSDGVTLETLGLDHDLGEAPKMPGVHVSVYLIDQTRLDDAPQLAAAIARTRARTTAAALAAEERAQAEDDRHLGRDY